MQFIFALLITVAVETLVLFALVRKHLHLPAKKLGNRLVAFSGVLASALTLPYLWFVLPYFIGNYWEYVFFSEAFAIIVEAAIYHVLLKQEFRRALLLSLACNLVSFALGFAIYRIF